MRVLILSLLLLVGCQPTQPLKEANFTIEAELLEMKGFRNILIINMSFQEVSGNWVEISQDI